MLNESMINRVEQVVLNWERFEKMKMKIKKKRPIFWNKVKIPLVFEWNTLMETHFRKKGFLMNPFAK